MSENVDPENPRPNKSIPSERRFYFDIISTRARVARGVPLSFLPLIWQKLVMLNASDTRVTLASNMTSFYQISGEEREGYPRTIHARA